MDPRNKHGAIPVRTEPPTDVASEKEAGRNRTRTAVVVCHGMGQQVRFQTIGDLVKTAAASNSIVGPVVGRLVRFSGNLTLPRAEVTFADGDELHEAHIYEAYWASFTQGRVTLRDVMTFLLRAGVDGAWAARRGEFQRLIFNKAETFKTTRWTFLAFVAALAVILSLLLINIAVGAVVAVEAGWPHPAWAEAEGFSRAVAGDMLVLILGLAAFLLAFVMPRRSALVAQACEKRIRGASVIVSSLPIYGLVAATIVAGGLSLMRLAAGAFAGSAGDFVGLFWPEWLLTRIEGDGLLGLWGIAFALILGARWFLVHFVGDVAAYLSAHRLSKFDEVRDAIKKTVFETTCAVYRDGGYGRCVMVGHSLGAVAAYDALNAVLNEESVTGANFAPTVGLLTFGAPLDKTAFVFRTHNSKDCDVREALAAAVQPLISFQHLRPRWVNIWSPNDIISGSLDLYDRADKKNQHSVVNLIDWQANRPLYAHVQYWKNELLAKVLRDLCRGADPEDGKTACTVNLEVT